MIIKDWKNFLISMKYFLKLIFSRKEYDVVFVSSIIFNRGPIGENLLLKPMIDLCEKDNLRYIIFEDTDLKGIYDNFSRSNQAMPFDFISLFQIILRKLYKFIYIEPLTKDEAYQREYKISKILKTLFFRRFHSKVYITLIWNNATLWRSINPDACIIDYQHGVIFDGHNGYLIDGKTPKVRSCNDLVTMVYGESFKNILINNDKFNYYNDKNIIKIGINKPLSPSRSHYINTKKILFTLQITPDYPLEANKKYVKIIQNLISANAEFLNLNQYKLIFRHHPRYSAKHCPAVNFENSFIDFDNKTSMAELFDNTSIHITFNSTSAFEASIIGLPTIFIDTEEHESLGKNFSSEIFLKQYQYPQKELVIKNYKDLKHVLLKLENKNNFNNICNQVHEWSKGFYDNFDESEFSNFISSKIDTTKTPLINKND